MKNDKQAMDANSSADNVEEYLQTLGNDDAREMLYHLKVVTPANL